MCDKNAQNTQIRIGTFDNYYTLFIFKYILFPLQIIITTFILPDVFLIHKMNVEM